MIYTTLPITPPPQPEPFDPRPFRKSPFGAHRQPGRLVQSGSGRHRREPTGPRPVSVGVAAAAFLLVLTSAIPGLSHWTTSSVFDGHLSTGSLIEEVDGALDFALEDCDNGRCRRFEDDDLAGHPFHEFSGATLVLTGWIDKNDEPGEHVGFTFHVSGGAVELEIRSGDPENPSGSVYTVEAGPGTHLWLNPSCTLDEPGPTAMCDPNSTGAISYIDVCMTPDTPCDAVVRRDVTVANAGSIPFRLILEIGDPTASLGACDDEPFEITVDPLDEAGDPIGQPVFEGLLCDLVDGRVELAEQLDPGMVAAFAISVEIVDTDEVAGTYPLTAAFVATQWNTDAGWQMIHEVAFDITAVWGEEEVVPEAGDIPARDPAPVEDPPAQEPVEPPPPVDPPADDPPEEQPPSTEPPPAEEPPADDPPEEQPPSTEPPPAEDLPGGEPPVADPPIEDPPDEPPNEEPPGEPPPPEPPEEDGWALEGIVWFDDGDGVRLESDMSAEPAVEGEARAEGVVVALFDRSRRQIDTTVTDAEGRFRFAELPDGRFFIGFQAPDGYAFAAANAGDDPTLDSDVEVTRVKQRGGEIVSIQGRTGWLRTPVEPGGADVGLVPLSDEGHGKQRGTTAYLKPDAPSVDGQSTSGPEESP